MEFQIVGIEGDAETNMKLAQLCGYVEGQCVQHRSPHAAVLFLEHVCRVQLQDGPLEVEWTSAEAMVEFGHLFVDAWRKIRQGFSPFVTFVAPKMNTLAFNVSTLKAKEAV